LLTGLSRSLGANVNKERELLIQAIDAYDIASSPCSDRLHHAFEEIRNYLICEPESDEPVAWSVFDGEGGYDYISYENNETYKDEFISRNRAEHYKEWVQPLYTRPAPARKPMTEEEIENLYDKAGHHDFDMVVRPVVEFARAIEKHHGIKEEL